MSDFVFVRPPQYKVVFFRFFVFFEFIICGNSRTFYDGFDAIVSTTISGVTLAVKYRSSIVVQNEITLFFVPQSIKSRCARGRHFKVILIAFFLLIGLRILLRVGGCAALNERDCTVGVRPIGEVAAASNFKSVFFFQNEKEAISVFFYFITCRF